MTDSVQLDVTDAERTAGNLSPDTLAAICAAIETTGYAVLTGLITPEVRNLLVPAVLEDTHRVRAGGKPTRHERATAAGHLQLGLRRYAPYVHHELVANPLIEHVVGAVLGRGAWLGFYNGNVNCPGSGHQPLHFDRPYAWKTHQDASTDGQPWPPPTITLSCSVALTDIGPDTGATQIYPGTHHETAVVAWPPGERPEQHPNLVAKWSPPAAMTMPAGSVCFRDPRMWHRGVPNPSDTPRPMIALTYHSGRARHWRGLLVRDLPARDAERCEADPTLRVMDDGSLGDGRLVFDASARAAFEAAGPVDHGIDRNVRYVHDPNVVNHFLDAHEAGGARVQDGGAITPHAPAPD